MEEVKVDLLINNAHVYNRVTREFQNISVTVMEGKFYWLTNDVANIEANQVLDLNGKYLIPGLIDSHMHIESSMTTPQNFGNAVAKFGTTTVIADAHEIANVAGVKGLKSYMGQDSIIDVFYAIPSSVPSTNTDMETTGGTIIAEDIEELISNPKVICLGEAMNFQGITSEPNSLIRKIIERVHSKRPTMPIEGHCPKYAGLDLAKFIYSGVTSDHTQQTADSVVEKIMNGMFIQLQRKSINEEILRTISSQKLFEHVALVTDDVMPDDLQVGHLNEIVKLVIKNGLSPEEAIYLATYTPARRMGLWDRGSIMPGRVADFVVLDDINTFKIDSVYKNGKKVGLEEKLDEKFTFDDSLVNSVKAQKLNLKDFDLCVEKKNGKVNANVIQISKQGTFTKKVSKKLRVDNHKVCWEEAGLALLMIQERYGKTGDITFGLVDQSITQLGAIGATWAHDHHNIMVLGTEISSMLAIQNQLIEKQGGYMVAKKGKVTVEVGLPVGGVVSELPIKILGDQVRELRKQMRELGYVNTNEIMSFSTLSLLVSPELKMSDKGLFDVKSQALVKLFE